MARRRASGYDNETAERETANRAPDTASPTRRADDGAAREAAQLQGEADEATGDQTMQRAEEMVDRMADRVGEFTSYLGRKILQLGARAREEAEDIWAEAQSIRRGRQS